MSPFQFTSLKWTHISAVFEISQHGGWENGTSPHLLASYLLNPSPQTMRTQAGVNAFGGGFNVPFLDWLPGDDLVSQVAPGLVIALRAEQSKELHLQVK